MVVTSYEGDEDDARRLIAIHRALAAWMGSDDARGANALEWEEVATHLKPPHNSLAETDLAEHEIDGLMGHASTFGFTYHSSARTGVNPATDDPIATAARAALEQYRRQVADGTLPDATQDPANPLDISRLIRRVEGGSLPEVIPLHPPGSPEAALAAAELARLRAQTVAMQAKVEAEIQRELDLLRLARALSLFLYRELLREIRQYEEEFEAAGWDRASVEDVRDRFWENLWGPLARRDPRFMGRETSYTMTWNDVVAWEGYDEEALRHLFPDDPDQAVTLEVTLHETHAEELARKHARPLWRKLEERIAQL